ncbi:hypothetical protein [Thalassotalea sediminis]|uniref:hypothetical protein n=1 Tax=Thalassotalea sediminis TaxID=1759089 RepID=UPI002572FD06|nr:hypothetical protein [Thalassotalea sediminis]
MYGIRSQLIQISLCLFICFFNVNAIGDQPTLNKILLSQMGKFDLSYSEATPTNVLQGSSTIGLVTYHSEASFKVTLPFTPQQLLFSKTHGSSIKKGDVIAKVDGLEVNHYFDELASAELIYLKSKTHLNRVKSYASSNTIKSTEWLSIIKAYHAAKLNYEHLSHVREQLNVDEQGRVFLISPISGILYIPTQKSPYIFEVIPEKSIYVQTSLPVNNLGRLTQLKIENSACSLSTDVIVPLVHKYKQTIRSKFSTRCALPIGTQLLLTPLYQANGYSVDPKAVFELHNKDYVAVKIDEQLILTEIEIIGKDGTQFIVRSNNLQPQDLLLVSSTSIAQGIFMGLGE